MERRSLGEAGIEVSVLGLGCNSFGFMPPEIAPAVIDAAIDQGVNFFDTADVYGRGASETALGAALGPRRQHVVIATKFGGRMDDEGRRAGASAKYVREACEASLKRLRTDWIDVYQLHRPDPDTPLEETLRALDDLVAAGKVRAVGCSNLAASDVARAADIAYHAELTPFSCAQDNYSLLERGLERDLAPVLRAKRMSLIPYLPLASGMLSGKYRRGAPPPPESRFARLSFLADAYSTEGVWSVVERLEAFAEARGRQLLDIALGWLAARSLVATVIAGATTSAQVAANAAAVAWRPSEQDLAEIDAITLPAA